MSLSQAQTNAITSYFILLSEKKQVYSNYNNIVVYTYILHWLYRGVDCQDNDKNNLEGHKDEVNDYQWIK
jgi:hypothetical protein